MTTPPTPPPQPTLDPNTLALVERISAALGRTGPVLTPLQALLMDVRARLREMGEPPADACAPSGIDLARVAQAAMPHVMCHAFCDLQLQVGDCDCGAQKALADLTAALAQVQPTEGAQTAMAQRAAAVAEISDPQTKELLVNAEEALAGLAAQHTRVHTAQRYSLEVLDGIANATPKDWLAEGLIEKLQDFLPEFHRWAQSLARHTAQKIRAANSAPGEDAPQSPTQEKS